MSRFKRVGGLSRLSDRAGHEWRGIEVAAVYYKASGIGNTVPADVQPGDLIVLAQGRDGNPTIPSAHSGYTTLEALTIGSSSTAAAIRVSYRMADGSEAGAALADVAASRTLITVFRNTAGVGLRNTVLSSGGAIGIPSIPPEDISDASMLFGVNASEGTVRSQIYTPFSPNPLGVNGTVMAAITTDVRWRERVWGGPSNSTFQFGDSKSRCSVTLEILAK